MTRARLVLAAGLGLLGFMTFGSGAASGRIGFSSVLGVVLILVAYAVYRRGVNESHRLPLWMEDLQTAAHPSTSSSRLDLLSQSSEPVVRVQVALHPAASTAALEVLAADPDVDVARTASEQLSSRNQG